MNVLIGKRQVKFPSPELQQLNDSNHLLGDREKLLVTLQKQGYLYLKNFHNPGEVYDARLAVLEHIKSLGEDKLHPDYPEEEGILNERCGLGCLPMMEGKPQITHSERLAKVLEGPRAFRFFEFLFGEEALTFDYKWLRAMHNQGFTGAHVDNVYMSRGTDELLTLWTPLGDITPDMGTLAVCEESNHLNSFKYLQNTYGNLDLEKSGVQGTGWFTEDPWEITKQFGGIWKTSAFEAGDALIFTLRTVHMSTVNLTNKARISCDTRWQPKDAAVDNRYMGEHSTEEKTKFGVHATGEAKSVDALTIEQLKKSWGFTC